MIDIFYPSSKISGVGAAVPVGDNLAAAWVGSLEVLAVAVAVAVGVRRRGEAWRGGRREQPP
jgi:hypothetical protein